MHCAASLNRKSEKSCLNVNLRGTLEVVQLARRAQDAHGLRRFSQVSTVAVAGERSNEVVHRRRVHRLGPLATTIPTRARRNSASTWCANCCRTCRGTVFRPSIVLGDSRRPETTQFDMVRAFVFLAGLPVLPLRAEDRIDIVPVDYVADAIVTLHQKPQPGA